MALSKVLTRPMRLSGLISRLGISPLQSIRSFHEDMVSFDEKPKPIDNPFQISGPKTSRSVTKDDEFGHHVRFDMPGVDRKVRVMVGNDPRFGDLDLLIISGWSVYDIREKNDEHLLQLVRSLPRRRDYNFDQIKAVMEDGVMRVFVPFKDPAASD